jgi:hypothetical protein
MKAGRIALSDERRAEVISRRSVLSLLGWAGASALAAASVVPTQGATIPPAFAQVDKPLPGEGGAARTAPPLDKPIPADETGTRTRRLRRKPVRSRAHVHRRRGQPHAARQPASPEIKPK